MPDISEREAEPVGPFEFSNAVEIERPAADVYALVDWGDARNAKRVPGNRVERVGSAPDRYRLWLEALPGHVFDMVVSDAVPGRLYAFETTITPAIGQLASSRELYELDPLGEGACRLRLTVTACFTGGLSDEALASEVMMMAAACENAMVKLKLQAEQGAGAVQALEARQAATWS